MQEKTGSLGWGGDVGVLMEAMRGYAKRSIKGEEIIRIFHMGAEVGARFSPLFVNFSASIFFWQAFEWAAQGSSGVPTPAGI